MDAQVILIIVIAALIGFLYILWIRSLDRYEKEPLLTLLMVTIFGGILAIIISLIIYEFVDIERTFFDAIFKIGVIEELAKFLTLVVIYTLIRKDFNEIVDGIIYISAISLGFAIIENIFYTLENNNSFSVLFVRSILTVLAHLSFSGFMGVAFFIHVKVKKNYFGILFSIVFAILAHGLYDGIVFQPGLNFLFYVFLFLIISLQAYILKTTLAFSKFKRPLSLNNFKEKENRLFLNCCNCQKSIRPNELDFWKIKAGTCESCGNFVTARENIRYLLIYYRPALRIKKFFKKLPNDEAIITFKEDNKIKYNHNTDSLSANITSLEKWLDNGNEKDKSKILSTPVLGTILKLIGIRYLTKTN